MTLAGVSMADYDAIVIGAGHNGLVAANVLAKGGARVLVLERAHFLGGMAATRELFDGYKHSVGAWAVLIWRQEMRRGADEAARQGDPGRQRARHRSPITRRHN